MALEVLFAICDPLDFKDAEVNGCEETDVQWQSYGLFSVLNSKNQLEISTIEMEGYMEWSRY